MRPIKLEEAPEELQKAINEKITQGYELLQLTVEEQASGKQAYESIVTLQYRAFINIYFYSKIGQQNFDSWFIIEALKLSKSLRNSVKRNIKTIEKERGE